ncbi:MAG: hypothetical protein B1H04_06290 [Planctomycetales bacterium 4484_123]|nr:MAG: hypothetical protein B1H04_06290 [Planctomycetales bacterium 4484_123]
MISISRLNELAVIMNVDRSDRVGMMLATLQRLPAGAYLLGTGPSTVGIIPLTVDEVVLGRAATPLEEPSATVIDYAVADTLYFCPREVSRVHAKVVTRGTGPEAEHRVIDLNSTRGTFVNGQQISPGEPGAPLSPGDVLSLGPSQVSTYLFYVAGSEA